jgi:hypothetical protein
MGIIFSVLSPQFALARGLMVMTNFSSFRSGQQDLFSFEMLASPLYAMVIHIGIFLIVLLFEEYKPEIKGLFLRLKCRRGRTFFDSIN